MLALVAGLCFTAQAIETFSKNAVGNLETAAVWTLGAPTSSDVAVWQVSGNGARTNALGADVSWLGIRVDTAVNRDIVINTTGTGALTLGSSGIDMSVVPTSTANNLFTIKPNVILGAAQTWNVAQNTTSDRELQVDGVISGSSGNNLTKSGSGTLVLSTDNTYGGTTTISGGKLQVGVGGTTGTLGTGDVINNGSLVFQRTNTLTVANNISGNGSVSFIQTGTKGGTYILTDNNTYTGDTIITNGNKVIVGSDSNLGNGTKLYVGQNAVLNVTNSFATSKEVTMGGGNPVLNIEADQTLTLNSGVTSLGSSTNGFPISKMGAGKLVLNGAGSFSAKSTFYVGGGALDLGNAAALNGTTLRMNNNSLLDNTSGSNMTVTGMTSFMLNSGMTFTGSKDLDMSTAQAGLVGSTSGSFRTVTVSSNTLTLSGILATGDDVSGPVRTNAGLIKAGSGTLVLKGDSDYTFNTVITNNGGKLVINGINLSSNITVYAGATLTLNGAYMNDLAMLVLETNSVLNLDFTGNDIVGGIVIDGVNIGTGIFTSAQLDELGLGTVTGTGRLTVGPEPVPNLILLF
jgi:autotransporter-associated beta strand protein